MRAKEISILIACVILGLILLCLVFPRDGVNLGFTELRFPSLIEALQGDTTTYVDPEEQMARLEQEQQALQHAREDSSFIAKINQSSAKIWFPGDDVTYFDAVFKALEGASKQHVRIIHYGDSQLELDRISSDLREMLQAKFGGRGKGWIPVVPMAGNYTVATYCSPQLRQGVQYSIGDETRPRDRKGGPYATAAYLDGGSVNITVRGADEEKYPHIHGFSRIKVVAGSNGSELTVSCKGNTVKMPATTGLDIATIDVDSTSEARITISGHAHLYGVLVDSPTGVTVDNVPMRGCSGTIFSGMSKQELTDFFARERVPLILLQYGGNMVPGVSTKNLESVINSLRSQLDFFKEIAPNTRIMFIGPSDMSTKRGGGMHTYKNLPMFNDALRTMCLEAGVAYWDMFAVMGGEDSMASWVKSGYAGSDYVHFSRKGAERISGILNNTLSLYYDYYTFRNKQNKPTPNAQEHK
ncbi:MAG: hypothetical protein KBT09_06890 [Bacteroidales bacterium]|nr:hypothetical protein [Candidatus Sodaliphilus fimicaballi]